jgi:hypothetical protein
MIRQMFRSLSRILVDFFVNFFGITPPDAEHEKRAGVFIVFGLLGVIVILVLIAFTLFKVLH